MRCSPNNTMDEMNNDQVMGDEQETAAADMPAEETEMAPEMPAEETGEEAA